MGLLLVETLLNPRFYTLVHSLTQHLHSCCCHSKQRHGYKYNLKNITRRSRNTPSDFSCYGNWDKLQLPDGPLGSYGKTTKGNLISLIYYTGGNIGIKRE